VKRFILLAFSLLLVGCNNSQYTRQQEKLAKSGDYWAKFNLWNCYNDGTHGVKKDPAKARRWLDEFFVKKVWVVKFEPVNGFNPQNAGEFLKYMSRYANVYSGAKELGKAGFFRTTKAGGKLAASFLTNYPDQLQTAIGTMPDVKIDSVEPLLPAQFGDYVRLPQESL
jgi:hypothetical protein